MGWDGMERDGMGWNEMRWDGMGEQGRTGQGQEVRTRQEIKTQSRSSGQENCGNPALEKGERSGQEK